MNWFNNASMVVAKRTVRSSSTNNYNITLPVDLCKSMNISPGDKLVFKCEQGLKRHFMVEILRKAEAKEQTGVKKTNAVSR